VPITAHLLGKRRRGRRLRSACRRARGRAREGMSAPRAVSASAAHAAPPAVPAPTQTQMRTKPNPRHHRAHSHMNTHPLTHSLASRCARARNAFMHARMHTRARRRGCLTRTRSRDGCSSQASVAEVVVGDAVGRRPKRIACARRRIRCICTPSHSAPQPFKCNKRRPPTLGAGALPSDAE
jgi:hypothetical protein